jgi:hypothetical protein
MILNSSIWQATINEAKALSANNPVILRAINRAVVEIERSAYWSFDGQTLRIKSTTSRKLYVVDEGHTCEAQSKTCKHHIARRLLARYTRNLGVAVAEVEKRDVRNWSVGRGHQVVETKHATAKPSVLDEAGKAVLVKRTPQGDFYCGIAI